VSDDLAAQHARTVGAGAPTSAAARQADAIYQNDQVVARVIGAEVDLAAKEIRFQEVYNSDYLLLPHECEFDQFTIMVQRIGLASKIERGSEHKGRVLKGVVAEILRYR
jgi:hypothetical protein